MSQVYGPVALTANTMAFQDIGAGAAWVVVENSSLAFDLGVSFQVNSPGVVTQFSGSSAWAGVVQAGASKRFALPANDGQWTGRVWLFPLSVATLSAATGTTSGYSRAYVTVFGQNEQPLDFQGVIRGLDLTSQPRVIALPPGNQQWAGFQGTMIGAGNFADVSVIGLSGANIANGHVEAYMAGLWVSLGYFMTAATTCLARLDWVIRNNAGVALTSIPIRHLFYGNNNPELGMVFAPLLNWDVALPANAFDVTLRITSIISAATPGSYSVMASWWLDLANATPIAAPGNQSLHIAPGSLY